MKKLIISFCRIAALAVLVALASAYALFWAWYHLVPRWDDNPFQAPPESTEPRGVGWLSRLDFWIIDTGNALRTRQATKLGDLGMYGHMSDQEFSSRVLHSACLTWRNCLPIERYSASVNCRSPGKMPNQVTLRTSRLPGVSRKDEPSSRFLLCVFRNPAYFLCIDANGHQNQARFIATGPYQPIPPGKVESEVIGCLDPTPGQGGGTP